MKEEAEAEAEEGADAEDEEARCASLQSQSSIITVDPPSLPHEEEEEGGRGGEAEDLAPRGPITGKPTSYRPDNQAFNHVSSKSYTSHSLDRFHQQAAPFSPPQPLASLTPSPSSSSSSSSSPSHPMQQRQQQQQQQPHHLPQAVNGFCSQNGFSPENGFCSGFPAQSGFPSQSAFPSYAAYGMSPVYNNGGGNVMATGGKRGMDEDEDNPYKYTRPVEEGGYGGGLQQADFNDLSGGVKGQLPSSFSQVSRKLGCGGEVRVGWFFVCCVCVWLSCCFCSCLLLVCVCWGWVGGWGWGVTCLSLSVCLSVCVCVCPFCARFVLYSTCDLI